MAIETGLSFLLAPLVTAGAVLGILTFDGEDQHHLGQVSVTEAMAAQGYTSDVANHALKARIKDLYYRIGDSQASPLLPLLEERTSEVLATELHVDKIVLAARRLRGMVASEFDFAFIEQADGRHELHMIEVEGDDMRLTRWDFPVQGNDYESAIVAAARQVVREIDGTLIALDHLMKNELDQAQEIIGQCRLKCPYSDMATNHLLAGILALKQDKLDLAAASFRAAQFRRPDLWTATVGLAVTDVRRGEVATARARLATPTPGYFALSSHEARRVATLRSAEGRLLSREGHHEDAAKLLESAVEMNAYNYRLHIELAQVYQKLNFEAASAYQQRRAEQLRSGVYGSIDVVQAMLLDLMG